MHRFDFDGRYAYISPTCDGYLGNIVMILDLKNPAKPEEVGRWWMPGQWTAGGEKPTWKGDGAPLPPSAALRQPALHELLARRLRDPRHRRHDEAEVRLAHVDWSPPFPWPTHTCLRIPFKIDNRDFMVVSDEDVGRLEGCPPYPAAFLWMVDITDEKHPHAGLDLPDRGHARRGSSRT